MDCVQDHLMVDSRTSMSAGTQVWRPFWVALLWVIAFSGPVCASTAERSDLPLSRVELSLEQDPETVDLDEVSRQLDNPLTRLWSLTLEDSVYVYRGDAIEGATAGNTLFFQPGLPIPVGENAMFTARPVFPIVTRPELSTAAADGVAGHTTGFGDIQLLSLLGPSRSSGMIWGAGGTFKFPTASADILGSSKYQAGPAAMLFYIEKPWVAGALVQHWWSYAGDPTAPGTSQTDIQYVCRYSLPKAWSIGMGPTLSIDWNAPDEDRLTLPVGLGLTKTVRMGKIPVKLRAEAQYAIVRPKTFGYEWRLIFRIAPVIPSPFNKPR